jgi:hypothetical protein
MTRRQQEEEDLRIFFLGFDEAADGSKVRHSKEPKGKVQICLAWDPKASGRLAPRDEVS